MQLKESDLIENCPMCDGEGVIHDPPQTSGGGGSSYGQQAFRRSGSTECVRCSRTGKVVTESGEAVLKLIALAKRQLLI